MKHYVPSSLGSIPAGADIVLLGAEVANVRWHDDGQSPSTVGQLLLSADEPQFYSGTRSALKFIAASAGAILDVSFYKAVG